MSAKATTAAPTGRKKIAHGKERSDATLGHDSQNTPSPEGAKYGGSRYHVQLPKLPASWSYQRFENILDVQGGSQPPKSTFVYEPTPGYIQLLQIRDFGERGVPTYVREDSVTKRCTEDDVLIARYGASLGRIVTGEAGAYNVALAKVIFDREQFFNRYLFYLLKTPFFQTPIHMISRSAQNGFNKGDLSDILLPVASIPEQRRIVAEIEKQFTRLEAGMAALRRVQANLKRYRAAVLKAACEGRLVPTEAEWKKTTLGEVSIVLAGYGFPERFQGRATGDIGFFKVGDISGAWKRNEKILTQANHYISKADLTELRAKLLPTGTVVFAKIGAAIALNRRAIIGEPSLVDNNVMGLLAGERIHPRYLFHFLCTQKLDELARATTVPSIRKGDVEGIQLELPPLAEQTRIVAEVERRLSVVEELESVVTANLQRATRLRQSILQKAFTGKLV